MSIVLELRKRRVTANARQHAQGKLQDKYLTNPRELVKPIVRTTKPLLLCHIQTDPAERLTPLSTWHSVQRRVHNKSNTNKSTYKSKSSQASGA